MASNLSSVIGAQGRLNERPKKMRSQLLFMNLPHDCSDRELKDWIESRGIETTSIRIIRDLVAGVSPAFAYAGLKDEARLLEAVSVLDGKKMRNQTISVKQAAPRSPVNSSTTRTAKA